MNDAPSCPLVLAAGGGEEPCPRDRCAFWESGGCAIERLGIDLTVHDLAAYLLDVRMRLEHAGNVRHAGGLRGEFARRLGREL